LHNEYILILRMSTTNETLNPCDFSIQNSKTNFDELESPINC
jgi:hypothetical protein